MGTGSRSDIGADNQEIGRDSEVAMSLRELAVSLAERVTSDSRHEIISVIY